MSVRPSGLGGRDARTAEVRVWDPLVRVVHWSLLLVFVAAWASGEDAETFHEAAGYALAGLTVLRIAWGLVGPRRARFTDFVRGPRAIVGYLRDAAHGRARRHLGHNPAGGAMIVAMLFMLLALSASGAALSYNDARWLKDLHESAVSVTVALIAVHVAGVIFTSLAHRENLTRAMFTGRKRAE